MQKSIYQYIKNDDGQLVGCVAAVGAGKVGWSLCRMKQGWDGNKFIPADTFSKTRAVEIAVGRATVTPVKNSEMKKVPYILREWVQFFKDKRSVAYFKD